MFLSSYSYYVLYVLLVLILLLLNQYDCHSNYVRVFLSARGFVLLLRGQSHCRPSQRDARENLRGDAEGTEGPAGGLRVADGPGAGLPIWRRGPAPRYARFAGAVSETRLFTGGPVSLGLPLPLAGRRVFSREVQSRLHPALTRVSAVFARTGVPPGMGGGAEGGGAPRGTTGPTRGQGAFHVVLLSVTITMIK